MRAMSVKDNVIDFIEHINFNQTFIFDDQNNETVTYADFFRDVIKIKIDLSKMHKITEKKIFISRDYGIRLLLEQYVLQSE